MTRENEVLSAFEAFTGDYDSFMERTGHVKAIYGSLDRLRKFLKGRVLDVATGTGFVAHELAGLGTVKEVIGVDISEKMLLEARKKASRKEKFVRAEAEQLPFPDNSFDAVTCCLGLAWFADHAKALKEMARVCREDGAIIVMQDEGPMCVGRSEGMKRFADLAAAVTLSDAKAVLKPLGWHAVSDFTVKIDTPQHILATAVFRMVMG